MIDPRSPNYASTPVSPDRARCGYAPRAVDAGDDLSHAPHRPAVTVITPFFNTGPVFHETAACVLGQSLQDFEWIIINDRSTRPEALAVLDEYRPGGVRNPEADPRIRIIDHAANHGLSAARNTGFRAARAPYVFQLDSDDLIEPTTLEKCAWFLECNPEYAFVKGFSVGFEGQEYLWEKGFHNRADMLEQNLVTATAMIRREVHEQVGGFDETIRGGLEDWDFWLRCAHSGLWGGTIPEFLDWYRRRPPQQFDAWTNLKCAEEHSRFRARLRREYPELFEGRFPCPERKWHGPHADIQEKIAWSNPLASPEGRKRLLMILPWLRMGGADKFNLDLLRQLTDGGWEVTIATTLSGSPWLPEFARHTPDIFMLDHLATLPHYPRLLRYLIDSRRPDVVLISNSELGYLVLPYLREKCPAPVYVDYSHMEEEYWKNGGHPRSSVGAQDQLDLNIVASNHLKRWMVSRGAAGDRVEVCNTNVDAEVWRRNDEERRKVRTAMGIPEDTCVLVYPVRLTAQKQPMVFADTMKRLIDRAGKRSWVALVAGEGEDRPALEAFLDRHGLRDFVRTLGAVPLAQMHSLYSASDIFFLPSMQEGIALSIFEAMAMQLAVVAADVGGQRELVVKGAGFLFPLQENKAEEAEAYAQALARLIASPEERRSLGQAARRHVIEHHRLQDMGQRMPELFEHAHRLKASHPRQVLTPGLAREIAVTGIDWIRTRDLCEVLWSERDQANRWREERERERRQARDAAAQAAEFIRSSTSFRLVQKCKQLPPYALYARARFGRNWRTELAPRPDEAPEQWLDRLRSSRAYRTIRMLKKLPPATVVTRLRHGKDYREQIPEPLRRD